MSSGGFINEMLASKHAKTNIGFLWRYLYYMYIAFPLLIIYFLIYQYCFLTIVDFIKGVFGLPVGDMSSRSLLDFGLVLGVNLGVVVLLYHFKILPVLFVPVNYLTRV
jgi:hypothetical protein